MKILLLDVDSKIPNIALMKLSAWHKAKGDEVRLIRAGGRSLDIQYTAYDGGYASVIFTKNKDLIADFPFEVGGTGISMTRNLEYALEHLMPDYSLYPDNKFSIGFSTRGCVRDCSFCFVPEKEGMIRYNADISEFYNPTLPIIMLLDNNILSYRDYKKVFDQIRSTGKPVTFQQGVDFRLLNKEKATELLSLKYYKEYIFAYDSLEYRVAIERNMNSFRHMFKPWGMKFYVLVGYDTTPQEDVFRLKYLKENKCLAYVMRHEKAYTSEYKDFYTDIASYANQYGFFRNWTFDDYMRARHKNQVRIENTLLLWNERSI